MAHDGTLPGTMYERAGGQAFFDALVDRFYDEVAEDPVLRPLYPQDLTESRRHMALFLAQYWGGPPTYMEERGHPRLRMRHVPFVIGQAERDAWARHMVAAVRAGGLDPDDEAAMVEYFEMAATHLINQADGDPRRFMVRVEPGPGGGEAPSP